MAPPLVRDTPVDKRVPGTINDADLWTERIEQQPKNNQERKKREAMRVLGGARRAGRGHLRYHEAELGIGFRTARDHADDGNVVLPPQ